MIFAIAVDSSIGFKKKEYFFEYKGREFKYVPQYSLGMTDDFLCRLKTGESYCEIYELMAEFLAALAFARDAKIIPHPGMINDIDFPLKDVKISFGKKRSINVEESMDEFYYIPPLKTKEQIQLARLYRQANSANSCYLKVLFYWHTLVYPSKKDDDAIDFINKIVADLPKEIEYVKSTLNQIAGKRVFSLNEKKDIPFGNYIKDGVRHSIAHIVRRDGYGVDLCVDSWEQESHLEGIVDFLKAISKYRLENDFNMKEPHEYEVFHYI